MKKLIFILFVSINCLGFSQTINSINWKSYEMKLKNHLDSFNNISSIKNGKIFLNSDTLDLKKEFPDCYYDYQNRYPDKISTFITRNSNDSLALLLFFYDDKLIEFATFLKGSFLINNSEIYLKQNFKESKKDITYSLGANSIVKNGDRITEYESNYTAQYIEGSSKTLDFEFYEDFLNEVALLRIGDKKTLESLPSWCGIDSKNKIKKQLTTTRAIKHSQVWQ